MRCRSVPGIALDWCVEEAFADIVALHPAIGTIHRVAIRRWRKAPLPCADMARGGEAAPRAPGKPLRPRHRCTGAAEVGSGGGLAAAPVAGFDRRAPGSRRQPCSMTAVCMCRADSTPSTARAGCSGRRSATRPIFPALDWGMRPPGAAASTLPGPTAFLLHGTSREDKKWPVGRLDRDGAAARRPRPDAGDDLREASANGDVAEAIGRAVPKTVARAEIAARATSPRSSGSRRW